MDDNIPSDAAAFYQDTSEIYKIGNAFITAYQTSGTTKNKKDHPEITEGQADSYNVVASTGPVNEDMLNDIMNNLSDLGNQVAGTDFSSGSTGALISISQTSPPSTNSTSFDLVTGVRGDSQTLMMKIDSKNNVTLINFNTMLNSAKNAMGSINFGGFGEHEGNAMFAQHVDVCHGERVVILTVSDGTSDPYLKKSDDLADFVKAIEYDLARYIKTNSETINIPRFLAERATALGTEDNTTVLATTLTPSTDLQGQSLTLAIFDGTGHVDGRLSSALANSLPTIIPDGQKANLISREKPKHVFTRTEDLKRALTPEAKDPHIARMLEITAHEPQISKFAGLLPVPVETFFQDKKNFTVEKEPIKAMPQTRTPIVKL